MKTQGTDTYSLMIQLRMQELKFCMFSLLTYTNYDEGIAIEGRE